MSEIMTFDKANFETVNVYDIGSEENHTPGEVPVVGVIREMAENIGFKLDLEPNVDNIGKLIGEIGHQKTLLDNIASAREKLDIDPYRDGEAAYSKDLAIIMAREWVERSGLLAPVNRSFMNPELSYQDDSVVAVAVITGGVRNWMQRRASRLAEELDKPESEPQTIERILLAAGNRKMRSTEGSDVVDGMTEADYMESAIRPRFKEAGVPVDTIAVDSGIGDEVMAAAASEIGSANKLLVASNAGAWVLNAGQLRRAMIAENPDFDLDGSQLYVVSDTIALGVTGDEPTKTHQNPFSALGQITRNAQEIVRHQ